MSGLGDAVGHNRRNTHNRGLQAPFGLADLFGLEQTMQVNPGLVGSPDIERVREINCSYAFGVLVDVSSAERSSRFALA
jgi:hypothetical protein